jgi:uncharacterized protein YndB with AHSA1/START domain
MPQYRFITEWSFHAPVEKVWALTTEAESMSLWWPRVKKSVIRGGGRSLELGTVIDVAVRGILGDLKFTLEVARIERLKELLLKSNGGLRGFGLWTLEEDGGTTRTIIRWEIATTGWLMNLAGFFAKPLLERSHNRVMARGYEALKAHLEG